MLDFIPCLERLVHIGIYGAYLSTLQLQTLRLQSPRKPWTVRSIEVRGPAYKVLRNCYSFRPCVAFSTDRDVYSKAVGMAYEETCGELQRLTFTAAYHSIPFPVAGAEDREAYRQNPQLREHWPYPPVLNSELPAHLAARFVRLEWLIIRSVPLPRFYKLAKPNATRSVCARNYGNDDKY